MKILFVLHLPPPVHGAAYVGLQIKNSTVINESFSCKYINLGTSVTIEEIGKRRFVKMVRYFTILWKVFIAVFFHRPDLCYISMTSKCTPFYKDASLVFLVKLLGVRVVYHFHNKGVSQNQDKLIDDVIYKMVFANSEVILLSPNLYPDIQKYVSENHVHYCPNGIKDIDILPSHKPEPNVVELFFLSNLIESKGVFVLLEACKVLQKRGVPFHCTLVGGVGDIDLQQFDCKVQELNLCSHITYVGEKFGGEKVEFFSKADIFVHPTLNDCFPLVLLEAMQYSLPVVSTIEGGIPDIVDDNVNGFLVPRNSSQALAEKLELLITNSDLRLQMGIAARQKYDNEFKSNKFEMRMTQILSQQLKNKN